MAPPGPAPRPGRPGTVAAAGTARAVRTSWPPRAAHCSRPGAAMVALPSTATYTVQTVWSTGTDSDTSALDDVTNNVLGEPGISIQTGRDQPRAFAPPVVPHAGFDLLNEDRLYSPGGE